MKMPISEIADRYTILKLKAKRLSEEYLEELNLYHSAVIEYCGLAPFLDRLLEINSQIWDLEHEIRQGRDNSHSLEEIGRRALAIRDLNRIRVGVKNEIAAAFKSGFFEHKIDHASEDTNGISKALR